MENKVRIGDRIECQKMVMVITGQSDTAFIGYFVHNSKPIGQCSILKEMFTNPHYMDKIKVLEKGKEVEGE